MKFTIYCLIFPEDHDTKSSVLLFNTQGERDQHYQNSLLNELNHHCDTLELTADQLDLASEVEASLKNGDLESATSIMSSDLGIDCNACGIPCSSELEISHPQSTPAKPIYIVLDGGLVQEVHNIPANHKVHVLDYDIEGADPEDMIVSPLNKRQRCFQSIYKSTAKDKSHD